MCVGFDDGKPFRVSAANISELFGILNEGLVTYFGNVTSEMLFQKYILAAEFDGKVLKSRLRYKNSVNTKDLTPFSFTIWQIMLSNVLRHFNAVSSFGIYVLWIFVNQRMINLPIFILHHVFRCRNQGRPGLPYIQMLTSMFVKKWRGLHRYCGESWFGW